MFWIIWNVHQFSKFEKPCKTYSIFFIIRNVSQFSNFKKSCNSAVFWRYKMLPNFHYFQKPCKTCVIFKNMKYYPIFMFLEATQDTRYFQEYERNAYFYESYMFKKGSQGTLQYINISQSLHWLSEKSSDIRMVYWLWTTCKWIFRHFFQCVGAIRIKLYKCLIPE